MSSQRRIDSSRANGAKYHGPVTPEGKQNSSSNSMQHGLTAKTLVLSNEIGEEFHRILCGNEAEFTPQTETETHLVRELSAAQWRQYRCWAIETSKFDMQMDIMEKEVAAKYKKIDEPVRIALAFDVLAEKTSFTTLIRYETNFRRQYHKALSALLALRRERDKQSAAPAPEQNPIPEQAEPNAVSEQPTQPTAPIMQNEPNPNSEQSPNTPTPPEKGQL